MYWPNIAVKYAFWLWCFAAPTAGCVLACVVSDCAIRKQAYHVFWPADTPTGQHGIWKIFYTFYFHISPLQRHIGARIIPCRRISIKKILRVDSSRRARDTAAMLDHSRHRGESATKTLKFFVEHTINCVICNNHTIIDWMLLNFTPVIQQNCLQPGRKFEKSFCAVDRLSCQLELSKSKTSQFRSDLVFNIVNYVHIIFLHGG